VLAAVTLLENPRLRTSDQLEVCSLALLQHHSDWLKQKT